jgi:oligopeptidase B
LLEAHGHSRTDDWFWLRDRQDDRVIPHLQAENAFTEARTAHLAGIREELFEEIRSRVVETDLSVPVRKGPWWYYARTVEGLDYAIHCRIPAGPVGEVEGPPPKRPDGAADDWTWPDEQVLLDQNELAEGHAYFDIGGLTVSPGHGLLAYSIDTSGDEKFTLRFRSLSGGDDPTEEIEGTSYGLAWADDNRTVFYTRPDAANRSYQLWRHQIGSSPDSDVLVFSEPDERFHLGVGRTKDGAYVILGLNSKVTSEVHRLASDDPTGQFEVVIPRQQGVEYALEHHSGSFLVLTNDEAKNFRLVVAPASSPGKENWRQLIAERPDVRLDGIDVFTRHVVAYERLGGESRIRLHRLEPDGAGDPWSAGFGEGILLETPESPSTSWGSSNLEFDSHVLRYEYSSLVTPRSVYELDLDAAATAGAKDATLLRRQEVLGTFDPENYTTIRQWAKAPDSTLVPISIVAHRETPMDGTAPCLLYGYGAYEHSIDPIFSSIRLSLLDRGFVFAIAHVRGGGEMGRNWYEQGKFENKPNTFTDFVACAEELVSKGWTSSDRLVARGGSAGGLLIGAVANLAPELFKAMVAEVPFVDCLSTMLDESLPLTAIEWEEWGNPAESREIYDVMLSYSPYDNVRAADYPDLLVTAGLEDPRVGYWEPAKWVQKIRSLDPRSNVLFKVELEAGHGGPTGRYDAWRDEAFVLAFVLEQVGAISSDRLE